VETNRDGTAAVVHGALVIGHPIGAGRRAVVRAEDGVTLSVAGRPDGQGPCELLGASEVTVTLPPDPPYADVHVEISRDRLLATMRVERIPGVRYRLEDQPPNHSIVLRRLVQDRIPCPDITLEDLMAHLSVHGVAFGIDAAALDRIVAGGFGPEPVAKGIGAIPPHDGSLHLQALDERGTERYVRAGAVLAKVSAPLSGSEGRTVLDEPIPVGEPRRVALEVGAGATVEHDGRVVATSDGHARYAGGMIVVTPALMVEGDIRSTHGEVASPGSVDVEGSVEDGSVVRAKRNVVIGDSVRRATVEAGGSITIAGAAFDSTLRIGHTWAALDRLRATTAPLARDVARVANGVGQLIAATRQAGKTMHPIRALAMVLERIEPELERKIRAALAEADRHRGAVPFEILAALRGGQEELDAVRGGRAPIENLALVARAFEAQTARLVELTASRPELVASYLQKCQVEACGAVAITGKGVVESEIRIVGTLEVLEDGSIVRGGRLDVDGAAVVRELAAGAGSGLSVTLAPGSMLSADVIGPGVVLHLPEGSRRVSVIENDVRITVRRSAAA
jgi:hypothetical protein